MEEKDGSNQSEGGRLVSADDEYFGAINEIQRNLKERRLMFTILNIILPGILLGLGDMLSGADYPAQLVGFSGIQSFSQQDFCSQYR